MVPSWELRTIDKCRLALRVFSSPFTTIISCVSLRLIKSKDSGRISRFKGERGMSCFGQISSVFSRSKCYVSLVFISCTNTVNFTQWEYNKGWTFVGSYEDFGSLYNPPTSLSPDCRPVPVDSLDPVVSSMETAFDGVVAALKLINSTHCGCRDDWPTACVTFIY